MLVNINVSLLATIEHLAKYASTVSILKHCHLFIDQQQSDTPVDQRISQMLLVFFRRRAILQLLSNIVIIIMITDLQQLTVLSANLSMLLCVPAVFMPHLSTITITDTTVQQRVSSYWSCQTGAP